MCVCECERECVYVPSSSQLWREKKEKKRECVISVGIGFQQHYYD